MVGMATAAGGGEVIDVDIGTLPDSSVLIRFDEAVQVVVFDAEIPFAVAVAGTDIDSAVAVNAAEALLASASVGTSVPSSTPGSTAPAT
jgi:hypothetical protein